MPVFSRYKYSLDEKQLAKLSDDSAEVRIVTFDAVETSFIRSLFYEDVKNFKPLLLLEQLIRWFTFIPIEAPDRVLALILELLRSRYASAICYQDITNELDKIRQILQLTDNVPRERCMDLLDALVSHIKLLNCMTPSTDDSVSDELEFSIDCFGLQSEDFELAWSVPLLEDMVTLGTIADGLNYDNNELLHEHLLELQLKICDYPVEFLLQPPHIFLRVLHVHHVKKSHELQFATNRVLLTIVKQLQRGISDRCNIRNYAIAPVTGTTMISMTRTLSLLFNVSCLEEYAVSYIWRMFDLADEVIQTYTLLHAVIPSPFVQHLNHCVKQLLLQCQEIDVGDVPESENMGKGLMERRVISITYNELLFKVVRQNASINPSESDFFAISSLLYDNVYWLCMPQRLSQLCKLHNQCKKTKYPPVQEDMVKFKESLKLATGQLLTKTKLAPQKLLRNFDDICNSLMHLGSKSLVQPFVEALVKCTSSFISQQDLRQLSEGLILNLLDLTVDTDFHEHTLELLKKPITDHYNALMTKTNYVPGCSNTKLIRHHILGLPFSTIALKTLLRFAWCPWHSAVKQWFVDYLVMLFTVMKQLSAKDMAEVFELVKPLMPLIYYRSIDEPALQKVLVDLNRTMTLNGNICFLFHRDEQMRKAAIMRVAQALKIDINEAQKLPHDLFVVETPSEYTVSFDVDPKNPQTNYLTTLMQVLSMDNVIVPTEPDWDLSCVLHHMFTQPATDTKQRCYGATIIFLSIFREEIQARGNTIELQMDLSALHVPFIHVVDEDERPLRDNMLHTLATSDDYESTKFYNVQYWRLFFAIAVCGSINNLSLSTMRDLDIAESLKIKKSDLALVHASQLQRQFESLMDDELIHCDSQDKLNLALGSLNLLLMNLQENIKPDYCKRLWMFMHQYLRVLPSHGADLDCYYFVLELLQRCLRLKLPEVHMGLKEALFSKPEHSFIQIMQNSNAPLQLLQMVAECLVMFVSQIVYDEEKVSLLEQKLFVDLSRMPRTHYELRQLAHLRCVLSVLQELSSQRLYLHQMNVESYYHHFVQLSRNIKTRSRTGAQMQRDCLMIICQLPLNTKFKPAEGQSSVLRYLLSLHNQRDREVRALGWTAAAHWYQSAGLDAIPALQKLHIYLPVILRDRCLKTLMDPYEAMVVRELAGHFFEMMMWYMPQSDIIGPLHNAKFLESAAWAARGLHPTSSLDLYCDRMKAKHSCELISCCVEICVSLTVIEPKWYSKLCDSPFFESLTDIMKASIPREKFNAGYMHLCAGQISRVFTRCYQLHRLFINKTICRYLQLLDAFYALIDMSIQHSSPLPEMYHIEMLKLLTVFIKEINSCTYLCTVRPAKLKIVELILLGLRSENTEGPVMQYALTALYLLLHRAHDVTNRSDIIFMFNEYVEDTKDEKKPDNVDNSNICKENSLNPLCQQLKMTAIEQPTTKHNKPKPKQAPKPAEKLNGALLIYQRLDELFEKYYPTGEYSFIDPYTKNQVKVCQAIAMMLLVFPNVMEAATKNKLLHRILTHLERFSGNTSHNVVHEKVLDLYPTHSIIFNLSVIINMLITWHATPRAAITDPVLALRVVRLLTGLWDWFSAWMMLVSLTIRLMAVLTEYSMEVCKQTSQPANNQNSLLKRIVSVVSKNVASAYLQPSDMLGGALRIMINCCACFEGRLGLEKMGVLEMMDKVLKDLKRPDMKNLWLLFWQIFSRYEFGSKLCHLSELMIFIRGLTPPCPFRLRCIRIIRNMCYDSVNRLPMLETPGFADFLDYIVSLPLLLPAAVAKDAAPAAPAAVAKNAAPAAPISICNSYEEQYIVVVCLLRLYSPKDELRQKFRESQLHRKLMNLSNYLIAKRKESADDFTKVRFSLKLVDVLFKLFTLLKS